MACPKRSVTSCFSLVAANPACPLEGELVLGVVAYVCVFAWQRLLRTTEDATPRAVDVYIEKPKTADRQSIQ